MLYYTRGMVKKTTTKKPVAKRKSTKKVATTKKVAAPREDFYPRRIPFLTILLAAITMTVITMIVVSNL